MSDKYILKSRKKLIALREARGLGLRTAAKAMGNITFQQIHKLERGEIELTEDYALKLARFYGCTPGELLGDSPLLSAEEREVMRLAALMRPEVRLALLRAASDLVALAPATGPEPSEE